MLASLSIRNILLFENQHIEFGNGLNVLTGETGAGKSILLDCIGFVLGERQPQGISAKKDKSCEVSAEFQLPKNHVAFGVLEELGLPQLDQLILRRVVSPSGRSSIFVNDSRCTSAALRRLGHTLIEVHGQDTSRAQMNPSEHRSLLDSFAECDEILSEVATYWYKFQDAKDALEKVEQGRVEAEKEIDFLQHSLDEISELNPEPSEEQTLSTRRAELKSYQRHHEDLQQAASAIGSSGAEGMAGDAIRWLQKSGSDQNESLREISEAIDRAMIELNEATRLLDQLRTKFETNSGETEIVEERLHNIRRIARKHDVSPDSLLELKNKFAAELELQQSTIKNADLMPSLVKQYQDKYHQCAEKLSKIRIKAASRLDNMVRHELPDLKLKSAQFKTEISKQAAGPNGEDGVLFVASTNKSTPSGPIHQIASGGEFARFMLAMKVCLTSRNFGITMIFDEVDRDVGGATADAIGRRLCSLATETQLLVVTHSPQVAAYGNCHFRIKKHTEKDRTSTQVFPLSGQERVQEIARMLSGQSITPEAEAAAVSLIKDCQKKLN